MTQSATKTPIHVWIIGVLALLWNAGGAYDYAASQLRIESYLSNFSQEQLDYYFAFPVWMEAAWAIAVWGSLLGALALLLRKSWAVWLFGAAIAGLLVSTFYNFVLSDGAAIMGEGAVIFTVMIWVIALFLFFYARAMKNRQVLK
jgi:hypothetical protein